jgi:hypothetical protein
MAGQDHVARDARGISDLDVQVGWAALLKIQIDLVQSAADPRRESLGRARGRGNSYEPSAAIGLLLIESAGKRRAGDN